MAQAMTLGSQVRSLKELSKSGIVTLVLVSVLGGFLAGHSSEKSFEWVRLLETLIGVMLLASGSSALNQIQELELDLKMPRTASRPLPSGRITRSYAWGFVILSVVLGCAVLFHLSTKVGFLGLVALLSYNGLYTLWWKKHWAFAAVPGAIPGALPILMGFTAANGNILHPSGIFLFSLLFFWQMPHFWVLALRYREDYAKGGFPTLPVKLGPGVTKEQIGLWCLAYLGIALIAPLFMKVTLIYIVPTILISVKVVHSLIQFLRSEDEQKGWLQFFLWVNFSLIVYLFALCLDLWSLQLFPASLY